MIAACLVFARRFAALGEGGWALFCAATGVLYLAAFFGIASGSQRGGIVLAFVVLAFTAAVALGWAWVSALSARLMAGSPARGAKMASDWQPVPLAKWKTTRRRTR